MELIFMEQRQVLQVSGWTTGKSHCVPSPWFWVILLTPSLGPKMTGILFPVTLDRTCSTCRRIVLSSKSQLTSITTTRAQVPPTNFAFCFLVRQKSVKFLEPWSNLTGCWQPISIDFVRIRNSQSLIKAVTPFSQINSRLLAKTTNSQLMLEEIITRAGASLRTGETIQRLGRKLIKASVAPQSPSKLPRSTKMVRAYHGLGLGARE